MTFLTNHKFAQGGVPAADDGGRSKIRSTLGNMESDSILPLESFITFGDLLKYLRRRARLTQRELAIAVKYSEAQISRLEQNQRPPDLAAVTALFIPALYVDDEPMIVARLIELASQARGETSLSTFAAGLQPATVRATNQGLVTNSKTDARSAGMGASPKGYTDSAAERRTS